MTTKDHKGDHSTKNDYRINYFGGWHRSGESANYFPRCSGMPELIWNDAWQIRVKFITGTLVTLENLFPQNYRCRYRLEARTNSFHYHYSGKKKQHKHKLFGLEFLRTFPTLTPDDPGSKSFSPPPGPQENALFAADVHDFRCGRPWPEGLLKNFVQKKFALIFWPLITVTVLASAVTPSFPLISNYHLESHLN